MYKRQSISFSGKDKSAASISAGRLRYVLAIVVVTVPVNMEPQLDVYKRQVHSLESGTHHSCLSCLLILLQVSFALEAGS